MKGGPEKSCLGKTRSSVKEDDSSAGCDEYEGLYKFHIHKTGTSNRPMACQRNCILLFR